MNRNKEACHCRNITYGMIEDAVKNGAKTVEEVEETVRFATGCGQCRAFIECFVRELLEEKE